MKKTLITMALAAVALAPAAMAQKQVCPQGRQAAQFARERGVGPVVAVSKDASALPTHAQAFLMQVFPDASVAKVEQDFADNEYEVDMSNGYEVTFDNSGNWLQVEAPDGATLPSSTLTVLVPEEAVITTLGSDALLTGGVTEVVDEITVTPYGYAVEYVTGKVGKGKANVNKSDGSIILKAKKDRKDMRKGKMARKMKKGAGRPAKARMQAQPVVLIPAE